MTWDWLLLRPNVNGTPLGEKPTPCVPYTDWIFWHYHIFIAPRAVA